MVTDPQLVEFCFALDVDEEEGWPPAGVEGLWFKVVDDGLELKSAPMFLGDLSVGDVLRFEADPVNGLVFEWQVVRKSRHTTVWIMRQGPSPAAFEGVLGELRAMKCDTSTFAQFGIASVHVPESVSWRAVDEVLTRFASKGVAVAVPSLRHEEGDG